MIRLVQTSIQVQSDQYIPVEDIHGEMGQLEKHLDELEQKGVELEKKLRDNPNGNTLFDQLTASYILKRTFSSRGNSPKWFPFGSALPFEQRFYPLPAGLTRFPVIQNRKLK